MSADLAASTYLVDGVDTLATGVLLNHDGAGLWAGLTETVGTSTTPGSDRSAITGGVFSPYTLSVLYIIKGTGYADVWSKIRALRRRCKPGRTVTLTRIMPDPDGTDANTSHTTTARRLTDRPAWLASTRGDLDIDWWITEPWHGPSTNIAVAAGAHTVLGDVRTRRMTITLAAGATRTITNTTNGYAFTFSTTVPAGGVIVDVEARTATAVTGGTDMSRYLRWGKAVPMQLEAGSNTLTVSAGSASIDYQPAYL